MNGQNHWAEAKDLREDPALHEKGTDHGRRTAYKRERMKFHFCSQRLGHIKAISVPK